MKRTISKTAIAILLLGCGTFAHAGFITSSGTSAFARNNNASLPFANDLQDVVNPNQVGYLFEVTSPVTINSLGIWDGPGTASSTDSGTIGDGLEADAVVSLWSTTGMLLASATVPAGTIGTGDEFAYAAINGVSSLTLVTGEYILSANYEPGGNAFYNAGSTVPSSNGGTSALTTMSEITIKANRYGPQGSVPTIEDASAGSGYIEAYVGPTAAYINAIPEPSSFLLIGLVGTCALAWKRRQGLLTDR